MIYIEGKLFQPQAPNKGRVANSFYRDSNPDDNFTVHTDIQLPSLYFKKVDTVNMDAFISGEPVPPVVKGEPVPPVVKETPA
ncbi:MAG: hypothetical protein Nk1A_7960 [Endomicrobiia bacterium]|nr:MAG: hypothetical protein Nk1A_7960 [Endomicrobiia bacterium]